MTQLILGPGFIGLKLVRRLAALGVPVRALGHSMPPRDLPKGVEWIHADIRDSSALERALAGVSIVHHLFSATVPGSAEQDPLLDLSGNVALTLDLLGRCVKAKVQKLVFVSSGGTVYGIPHSLPIGEDAATKPIGIYGAGKLAIENYLHCYRHVHGLDYTVLRLSNPYGDGQRLDRNQGAIGTFMLRALKQEPITIWGDGEVTRDYLYIDDAIDALVLAAQTQSSERVFNIGSGVGLSLNDIVRALQPMFPQPLEVRYVVGRGFDVRANVLDIRRAAEQLHWQPQIDLNEGLSRMLAWMRRT